MQFEVVTLFPELVQSALKFGVLGRAIERGILAVGCEDPRAHTKDVHRTVDDRPYGGGPGMVLKPEPMSAAIDAAASRLPGAPRVYMSAQGAPLTQAMAQEFSTLPGLVLVAGRYEGLDERVIESRIDREVSIGDYVLSGGELAAMVLIDAVVRLLPGVVGKAASLAEESLEAGLLEYPHYTRPRDWESHAIPEVLLSGDHKRIAEWRRREAERLTRERRPDLWARHAGKGRS
jgi:tRNA (guanine37-N1)-methyltransferase